MSSQISYANAAACIKDSSSESISDVVVEQPSTTATSNPPTSNPTSPVKTTETNVESTPIEKSVSKDSQVAKDSKSNSASNILAPAPLPSSNPWGQINSNVTNASAIIDNTIINHHLQQPASSASFTSTSSSKWVPFKGANIIISDSSNSISNSNSNSNVNNSNFKKNKAKKSKKKDVKKKSSNSSNKYNNNITNKTGKRPPSQSISSHESGKPSSTLSSPNNGNSNEITEESHESDESNVNTQPSEQSDVSKDLKTNHSKNITGNNTNTNTNTNNNYNNNRRFRYNNQNQQQSQQQNRYNNNRNQFNNPHHHHHHQQQQQQQFQYYPGYVNSNFNVYNQRYQQNRNNNDNKNLNRNYNNRSRYNNNNNNYQINWITPENRLHAVQSVALQLDYYFHISNLLKDIYLRKHMNSQGWVNLKFISNFFRIKSLSCGDLSIIKDSLNYSNTIEWGYVKIDDNDNNNNNNNKDQLDDSLNPIKNIKIRALTNPLNWVLPENNRENSGLDESVPTDIQEKVPINQQEESSDIPSTETASSDVVESTDAVESVEN